jgi:nitrous oxidase accessory protein
MGMDMERKIVFMLSLFLLFFLPYLGFKSAEAKAYSGYPVHNLNTGLDYATIQEAIDANETLNGHKIFVEAGIYYERIKISKSIHLIGDNCNSIIDAENVTNCDCIYIDVGSVTIENFTLRNAARYGILVTTLRGLYFYPISSVKIFGNIIENNMIGGVLMDGQATIDVVPVVNMSIDSNIIRSNGAGVVLDCAENTTVINNVIEYNTDCGVHVLGQAVNNWRSTGLPVLIKDNVIRFNEGSGICTEMGGSSFNPNPVRIIKNIIENNKEAGVTIASGYGQIVEKNCIRNNTKGIYFSVRNTSAGRESKITANTLINNSFGVYFYWGAWVYDLEATFTRNNFINNNQHVFSDKINSTWEYNGEGNYWSNYTGYDLDHDGIGESPHTIDAYNIDHYPLVGMFSTFDSVYGYEINFISNSSIFDVTFNLIEPSQASLNFKVTGADDTFGFCRICIPKVLINGSYIIKFDGEDITHQVFEPPCSNDEFKCFYINYTHSSHDIEISGTSVITEFSSVFIMPLFIVATLVAVILYRRKHTLT